MKHGKNYGGGNKGFFGFYAFDGMVPLPSLEDYWENLSSITYQYQITSLVTVLEISPDVTISLTTVHLYHEDNQVMIVWAKFGQ